ncbi:quinate permease [Plectosphaerella plurivora]|uniref:Quinate permease n=1 Tax=Plectosphaerella plurivora TaxID=936078 RepID=A0A9P9A9Z8_9PEZI|nr:quinate permease [Plectosphaerella plurivora]
MAGGTSSAIIGAATLARANAGNYVGGLRGLWKDPRILYIALFASLGGLIFGYQQAVLGQAFVMNSFGRRFPEIANDAGAQGWLTAILQLSGWAGALVSGITCEVLSRKRTIFGCCLWVILGTYLTAGANTGAYLYAGRFFTGIGVGALSAAGPLYNAELAPPEIRGLLIAMQQLAITIGIMIAYWITYGTNFIGGTGPEQSDWAWRLPLVIQGIPAVILGIGIWFLPYSPRWLVKQGRLDDAVKSLARLRGADPNDQLIQIELLEIQAECVFERRVFRKNFPDLADKWESNRWMQELAQYAQIFRTRDALKRVSIGVGVMLAQQTTGIDGVIYYTPIIFRSLGLTDSTTSLLATGITGVLNVLTTIPAVLVIDRVGRKPLLFCGSVGMMTTMIILAILVSQFQHDWETHAAAGWGCVVMIWLYIINFAYSWGPVSWTLIAEVFSLSIRAKGTSIGASTQWMLSFVIALVTPRMLESISWGMYVFFASCLVAGMVFVYFCVPETKGRTLEEMDQVFGSKSSTEDLAELAAVQEEVGLLRAMSGMNVSVDVSEKTSVREQD